MILGKIADSTGEIWVNIYDEVAIDIFGKRIIYIFTFSYCFYVFSNKYLIYRYIFIYLFCVCVCMCELTLFFVVLSIKGMKA